ncbi:MAG TPA: ChaB family protein [Anaerolineae bacterium]|nr:ChaB family protein [Anaerolineae bacterium]
MDKKKVDGAQSTIARLTESQNRARRLQKRTDRKTQADQLVDEALKGSSLPVDAQARVRKLIEAPLHQFVEADGATSDKPIAPTGAGLSAGDPPTIELPPDVAELPPEAQAIWLRTYTTNLATSESQALHMAWADVYSAGYAQDDAGAWKLEQPNAAPDTGGGMTSDVLQQSIRQAVDEEKAYLSKIAEAGRVAGMGGGTTPGGQPGSSAQAGAGDAQLEEAFKGWGLTPEQVKIAAKGRA